MTTATWEDANLPVYATAKELATVATANAWEISDAPYAGRESLRLIGEDEFVVYQKIGERYRLVNVIRTTSWE